MRKGVLIVKEYFLEIAKSISCVIDLADIPESIQQRQHLHWFYNNATDDFEDLDNVIVSVTVDDIDYVVNKNTYIINGVFNMDRDLVNDLDIFNDLCKRLESIGGKCTQRDLSTEEVSDIMDERIAYEAQFADDDDDEFEVR